MDAKRATKSHRYVTPKGKRSKKKSVAAFKRHRGIENLSRGKAWCADSVVASDNASESCRPTLAVLENSPTLFTYARQIPTVRYEAEWSLRTNVNENNSGRPTTSENITWPVCDVTHNFVTSVEENMDPLLGLSGNRVVDIKHLLESSFSMQKQHSNCCTGGKIVFVKETITGLVSTFKFMCHTCNRNWNVNSHPNKDIINTSFVWGTLTSGSYYSQSSHILSVMDVPTCSSWLYNKLEKKLGKTWEIYLFDEIKSAGVKEKEIAISENNISSDGIPYITVYVDGGWSKRSYGHNFNASSGAACIIGKNTGKCLFLGVRNKFCYFCQYYENQQLTPKSHDCYKNYSGSSTGMEMDILVEGFQKSVEMHGIEYRLFIGDGDSSVFARLKEKVPYGKSIKKLECKNHAIKNYTSALYKIQNNTKLPLASRRVLKLKVTKLISLAKLIIFSKSENKTEMHSDLNIAPYHIFGNHAQCKLYFCKWQKAIESDAEIEPDKDFIPILGVVVWSLIQTAANNLARKSDRLSNETNNIAESFMAQLAKYNCGKRLNLTNRGSFQRRAHIAGISQIKGRNWHLQCWRSCLQVSPGRSFKKYFERKSKIREMEKGRVRRRLFKPKQNPDKNYGPNADDLPPDIEATELHILCQEKLETFQLKSDEITKIERDSRGQHGNDTYDTYRMDRLTASQFGMICKRRITTPCHNHVKTVLYKTNITSADLEYGKQNEGVAIALFEELHNKKVRNAGMYIDVRHGFLGASPDGIIDAENAVVEVKCFPSLKRLGKTIEEAAKEKKDFPFLWQNETITINKKHSYFYQLQGQLYCCNMTYGYLIGFVESTKPITVLKVDMDQTFVDLMVEKLCWFFKNCILPEIILRRVQHNLKCLDPKEIIDSQTAKIGAQKRKHAG